MTDTRAEYLDIDDLSIGHFVFIDLGWIKHPFPFNSFRIQSRGEIETIRNLGLKRIRYSSRFSVFDSSAAESEALEQPVLPESTAMLAGQAAARGRRELLAHQRARLLACERQFGSAANTYRQIIRGIYTDPAVARETTETLASGLVSGVLGEGDTNIQLLSENVGERPSLHSINVTIISLLLAKACGMEESAMRDIGVGALLHDVGKMDLPDRLRFREHHSQAEQRLFQEHVAMGVAMAQRMGVAAGAQLVIGQHHEYMDSTGYPTRVPGERLHKASRIVSLVNAYDNLCSPGNPSLAMTPHEALAHIFAQQRGRYDPQVLNAFVRMMGVYPPGSVVQLSDERYAMVVSVNSSRPLKPRIVIHDQATPAEEALVVDMEAQPELGIRRSIKPLQLPKAIMDYLSPRQRVCYFFERGRSLEEIGDCL